MYIRLLVSIEVKKDPGNATWLFVEVVCNQIKNGRFDQEVHIFDQDGDLVALSKHVSRAVELSRRKLQHITPQGSLTSKL
jgi:hypothetical protein